MLAVSSQLRVRLALAFAVLFSLPMSLIILVRPDDCDFQAYLTAAQLVREHRSVDIYDVPSGAGPLRTLYSQPGSPFHTAGGRIGAKGPLLYLYPPLLADLLVPLTWLSLRDACNVWMGINLLSLAATAAFLLWAAERPLLGLAWPAMFLLLLAFRPVLIGLIVGQVTAVLLLLWTAGIVLYLKKWPRTSAVVLALAAAIKLTPLLVAVPFFFWRDWGWLRWFAVGLASTTLFECAVNGPVPLAYFATHFLPLLSHGLPILGVGSFAVSAELLYIGAHGVGLENGLVEVPHWLEAVCRLAGYGLTGAILLQVYRLGRPASHWDRAKVLAILALLSAIAAPIAWRHAYCVGILLLLIAWKEALQAGATKSALALLSFCTVEIGFVLDEVMVRRFPGVGVAWVQMLPSLCSIALVLHSLRQMRLHAPQAVPTSAAQTAGRAQIVGAA